MEHEPARRFLECLNCFDNQEVDIDRDISTRYPFGWEVQLVGDIIHDALNRDWMRAHFPLRGNTHAIH